MKKNKIPKLKETEIAEIAQMFFEQQGWDMFPEVVLPNFNGRPDLIGIKETLCSVVECKQSLTYPILEQLTRWHHDWNEAKESEFLNTDNKGIPHLLIAFTEHGSTHFPPLHPQLALNHSPPPIRVPTLV